VRPASENGRCDRILERRGVVESYQPACEDEETVTQTTNVGDKIENGVDLAAESLLVRSQMDVQTEGLIKEFPIL